MDGMDAISEKRVKQLERPYQHSEATHGSGIATHGTGIEENEFTAVQKFIENALKSQLQVHLWADGKCKTFGLDRCAQGNPTQLNYMLQHLIVMIPAERADGRVTELQQSTVDVNGLSETTAGIDAM